MTVNTSTLTSCVRALIIACLFLTRLPMPRLQTISDQDQGRALVCFPLVGLLLGGCLMIAAMVISDGFSPMLSAALLLALWVGLTGALHLDGLADSADGWLAGKDKDKTLEIMQDPRCGTAAIVVVCCLLLIKFSAVTQLFSQQALAGLLLAPVVSRGVAVVMLLNIPPAKPDSIGKLFRLHAPTWTTPFTGITLLALLLVALPLTDAIVVLFTTGILVGFLRHLMLRRLEGATGDTIGASVEMIETAVLVVLCLTTGYST